MDALVARRDGRIVGSAGDSVLAEFASAVEAADRRSRSREELLPESELPKTVGSSSGSASTSAT